MSAASPPPRVMEVNSDFVDDCKVPQKVVLKGNENVDNTQSNFVATKFFARAPHLEKKLDKLQQTLDMFASDSARRLQRIEMGIEDILSWIRTGEEARMPQKENEAMFMLPPSTQPTSCSDKMPPPTHSNSIPKMFHFLNSSPPAEPISPTFQPFSSAMSPSVTATPSLSTRATNVPSTTTFSQSRPPLSTRSPTAATARSQQQSSQGVKKSTPHIKITGLSTKWYTKRHYPDFVVRLLSADNREFTNTQNWQIGVRLVAGNGIYVDHFLAAPALVFPINDGEATVRGLKFTAVTSRNGGYFQFEICVLHPQDTGIIPVRSQELRVLSERLRHEGKVTSVLELRPNDSILRLPGIGKKVPKQNQNSMNKLFFGISIEP